MLARPLSAGCWLLRAGWASSLTFAQQINYFKLFQAEAKPNQRAPTHSPAFHIPARRRAVVFTTEIKSSGRAGPGRHGMEAGGGSSPQWRALNFFSGGAGGPFPLPTTTQPPHQTDSMFRRFLSRSQSLISLCLTLSSPFTFAVPTTPPAIHTTTHPLARGLMCTPYTPQCPPVPRSAILYYPFQEKLARKQGLLGELGFSLTTPLDQRGRILMARPSPVCE